MSRSQAGALTANNIGSASVDDTYPHGLTLINITRAQGGNSLIWYRLDGQDPQPGQPDTFLCVNSAFIPHPAVDEGYTPAQEKVTVRMVSDQAVSYILQGNPAWKLS